MWPLVTSFFLQMTGGRQLDVVWRCFHRQKAPGGYIGVCLGCGGTITGLTYRLRRHASTCQRLRSLGLWQVGSCGRNNSQSVIKFTPGTKAIEAIARMVFATNLPFSAIQNKYFRDMIKVLSPGLILPCAKTLSTSLLDSEFQRQEERARQHLKDQWVTISGVF